MLIRFLIFLCITLFCSAGLSCASSAGIPYETTSKSVEWLHDWSEALAKAQEKNRPMMINFFTDICPVCDKLDEETFQDEELGQYLNDNFVNVKSNAGRTTVHAAYGIRMVPTTIFATSDGTEMGRIIGFWSAGEFLEGCKSVIAYWEENYG
jgi:thiol:disulfide interchange protein